MPKRNHLGQFIKNTEPLPTKNCKKCGTVFTMNYKLSKKQWESTEYCSRKCVSLGNKLTGKRLEQTIAAAKKGSDMLIGKIGSKANGWKTGKWHDGHYMCVHKSLFLKDIQEKYKSMFTKCDNYCYEHRIKAAIRLGRPLFKEEVIHHIDCNPNNNNIRNLYLFPSNSEHSRWHNLKNKPKLKCNLTEY